MRITSLKIGIYAAGAIDWEFIYDFRGFVDDFYINSGGLGPIPLGAGRNSVQKLAKNCPRSVTATHLGSLYDFDCIMACVVIS